MSNPHEPETSAPQWRASAGIFVLALAVTAALGLGVTRWGSAEASPRLPDPAESMAVPTTVAETSVDEDEAAAEDGDLDPPEVDAPGPVDQCEALEQELWDREEDDRIDWDEFELPELTEEELERVEVDPIPFDGTVLDADSEPQPVAGFDDTLDVDALDNALLVAAMDACWESEILIDVDAPAEEEEDDAAFDDEVLDKADEDEE